MLLSALVTSGAGLVLKLLAKGGCRLNRAESSLTVSVQADVIETTGSHHSGDVITVYCFHYFIHLFFLLVMEDPPWYNGLALVVW